MKNVYMSVHRRTYESRVEELCFLFSTTKEQIKSETKKATLELLTMVEDKADVYPLYIVGRVRRDAIIRSLAKEVASALIGDGRSS